MLIDDNNFRTWTQDDYRYNLTEAFDEEKYPDAQYRYFKDCGCLIVALAIMLRLSGVEKETDYSKFNPWILLERAKASECFDKSADFILSKLSELYPIEQFECVPYSREALIDSRNKGYLSLLMVPGLNSPYHYIVPDEILINDISVIDNKFGKTLASQYKKVYYILNFKYV